MTNKYKTVYKMDLAMALIERGHKVLSTAPNPKNQSLVMWIFLMDDTLESDFKELIDSLKRGL